jgi:ATP-dependent helicase/nuclease subunit B
VVELICSALEVVTGGFGHNDVFSYLKTDLVRIRRDAVDVLENYCVAYGVSGADWQSEKAWSLAGEEDAFDEEEINEIRRKVSEPVLRLKEGLCADGDGDKLIEASEFVECVFDFLEELGVREQIGDWIAEAGESGDYARADEHRQFYDRLVNVFDELAEVFGGERMGGEDYAAILTSAFSQLRSAFIPPSLDQVLVGSVERSRHPDLKAVFLIGATQRQFPVPVGWSGILSDEDRRAAEAADFGLGPTVNEKLSERQYLAYIAFTRASEYLCVTYPLADDTGSPECRSQFVGSLESLFEDLREESAAGEGMSIEGIHSETELCDLLCGGLGRDAAGAEGQVSREELGGLLDEVCLDERYAGLGRRVVSAIDYENRAELEGEVVKELFGGQVRSSATRLSTFAACPYQYFSRYVLELEERKEFKFEPLDVGVFYHRVLDRLLKRLGAEGKDFATVGEDEVLGMLRGEIAGLVAGDAFVSNFVGHSAHNAFIISSAGEVLEEFVLAMREMVGAGSFRPRRSEVCFGEVEGEDRLGVYRIVLSGGRELGLDGKIDRLDIAKVGGRQAAVVFDYKRTAKPFSWREFYHGLDMQLVIYVLAVRSASAAQGDVVGAFYIPVEVSAERSGLEELSSKAEDFNYKAKGIFNGEFFEALDGTVNSGWSRYYSFAVTAKDGQYGNYGRSSALRPEDFEGVLGFAESKIIELAEGIVSGRIAVHPYRLGAVSPCSWCKYKAVCRFDWQINDYNPLASVRKGAVLARMEGADG